MANANTITGKVKEIGLIQSVPMRNGDSFQKRELILDCSRYNSYDGKLEPNIIAMEFSGKHVTDLDAFNIGDSVEVTFALQGREYTDRTGEKRIFVSIRPYKIEPLQTQQPAQPQMGSQNVSYTMPQQPQAPTAPYQYQAPVAMPQPTPAPPQNGYQYPQTQEPEPLPF